ncbi:hypothetical protein BU14_0025s0069 [Porphyra umbilicalis]|uniref:Uncharacterized protein n=1 Tax=Porphyra umbilicalis TaxID=2786 RepID=A0A1X6PKE7_PORUM|nr:hypothetical protein BU14_0025s0069 [Porphyra umbilicalis]|eukprot:OSX81188.1 hypothetical protein BU14_0025s0069 [Porphyra umbilicalis]
MEVSYLASLQGCVQQLARGGGGGGGGGMMPDGEAEGGADAQA